MKTELTIVLDTDCSRCKGTGWSMRYCDTGRRQWSYIDVCGCVRDQLPPKPEEKKGS